MPSGMPPYTPTIEEIYRLAEELRTKRREPPKEDRKRPVYVKTVQPIPSPRQGGDGRE